MYMCVCVPIYIYVYIGMSVKTLCTNAFYISSTVKMFMFKCLIIWCLTLKGGEKTSYNSLGHSRFSPDWASWWSWVLKVGPKHSSYSPCQQVGGTIKKNN